MCDAKDWRHVSNSACLLCFLLCVVLNVHTHSASATTTATGGPEAPPHVEHRSNESRHHLGLIMLKYGDGDPPSGISLGGLQNLMKRIGLDADGNGTARPAAGGEHEDEHEGHEHAGHDHEEVESGNGTSEAAAVVAFGSQARISRIHFATLTPPPISTSPPIPQCPTASELHTWYHAGARPQDQRLTPAEFRDLCPTLIHLLDTQACSGTAKKVKAAASPESLPQYWKFWSGDPHVLKVWGASLLAVTVTSLGGVATIFLIRPLMRTRFYTLVVQFLIALAVGSLTGDAFLHLLPHALFPSDDDTHDHKDGKDDDKHMQILYRCLTALIGIYCFFVIERVTVLCQNRRNRRRNGGTGRRPVSAGWAAH